MSHHDRRTGHRSSTKRVGDFERNLFLKRNLDQNVQPTALREAASAEESRPESTVLLQPTAQVCLTQNGGLTVSRCDTEETLSSRPGFTLPRSFRHPPLSVRPAPSENSPQSFHLHPRPRSGRSFVSTHPLAPSSRHIKRRPASSTVCGG